MELRRVAGLVLKEFCVVSHSAKAGMIRFPSVLHRTKCRSVVLLALFPDEIRNTNTDKNQHRQMIQARERVH